jgi:hypothetical protein
MSIQKLANILRKTKAMQRCHEIMAEEARSMVDHVNPEEIEAEVRKVVASAMITEAQEMLFAQGPSLAVVQQDYLSHKISKIEAIRKVLQAKVTHSMADAKRIVESW